MAGRKEFEQVVASAVRQNLAIVQNNFVIPSLAVGASAVFDIFVPLGSIGRLQSMFVSGVAPSAKGATSGDHSITFRTTSVAGSLAQGVFAFDKTPSFNRFVFTLATSSEPIDASALVQCLRDTVFDSVIGMQMAYLNNTNAVLTNVALNWYLLYLNVETAK